MIRRAARNLALHEDLWDQPLRCSPLEQIQLQKLVEEAMERRYYSVLATEHPVDKAVIFTDASARAWGVVRLEETTLHVASGALAEMPIHEGEATAVSEGLAECKQHRAVANIVDNTIVFNALQKGHSANRHINKLCAEVATRPAPVIVAWVPSAENWARGPSRNQQLRLPEVGFLWSSLTWRGPQSTGLPKETDGDAAHFHDKIEKDNKPAI
jgi:hypothetical protein